jgi:pilus assembly protein CpaE
MNAPWNPNKRAGGVAPREAFGGYVCDPATADLVRAVAAEFGWAADKVELGGLHNAVQALSVSTSPQLLFVDLSESDDPLNDINALAEVCEAGTIVVATGAVNDVRLYRDLLASGLQDYLLKPLTEDALRDALLAAQGVLAGPKAAAADEVKPRSAIAVIGARGGVGTSSVASSLAWLMAERSKRSTALLDLDVYFGTGALAFDLEPGRGLTDALENPSRIDGLFIERALVRATEKLAVLSAEAPITQSLYIDGAALHHLQEEMRAAFDSVVIDLPREMAVANPALIADLQDIVLVTEQTLAATRDTIRLLAWLRQQTPQARITVVANKVTSAPPPEVAKKDFEASIERAIDIALPHDAKTAANAARQGKSLAAAAAGTKLGGGIDALHARLVDAAGPDGEVRPSLLDKLGLGTLLGKRAG